MCPGCEQRNNQQWLRDRQADLPDIGYSHVTFTTPDVLWNTFKDNPHLLRDLPTIGAQAIKRWVSYRYGVRPLVLVVPHTFGRDLKFNSHLHALVSQGGVNILTGRWVSISQINSEGLMKLWRYGVITYLRAAYRANLIPRRGNAGEPWDMLKRQYERRWNVRVDSREDSRSILRYAARYVRRPPIAQHRIRRPDVHTVAFFYKDLKTGYKKVEDST
jgi:hypothetical protein